MPVAAPAKLPRWAALLDWVALTYVTVGERVTYLGNLYECTVKGTTVAAGGPPADNAAGAPAPTWILIGANAPAWVPATPYARGDRVTNAGAIYLCIVSGVSAGAGGPTGTAGTFPPAPDIIDGSVHWIFLAAGTAVDTEPVEGLKDVGWIPGQRPPAQHWNWLLWLTYRWLLWLQDGGTQAWGSIWTKGATFNVNLPKGDATHNGAWTKFDDWFGDGIPTRWTMPDHAAGKITVNLSGTYRVKFDGMVQVNAAPDSYVLAATVEANGATPAVVNGRGALIGEGVWWGIAALASGEVLDVPFRAEIFRTLNAGDYVEGFLSQVNNTFANDIDVLVHSARLEVEYVGPEFP